MTLTDITNQIIGELRKNEVLNESNLKDALNIPKEFEDKADKIIKTSLKELEKTGFIVKIEGTNDWFLKQPLNGPLNLTRWKTPGKHPGTADSGQTKSQRGI